MYGNLFAGITTGNQWCTWNITYQGIYIEHSKRSRPMSLAMTIQHDNAIYVAADTRSSRIDDNFNQLSYRDNYQKVISSKTGKFLLVSTGVNELTTDYKTIADVVYDIDMWMERHLTEPFEVIAQYAADMFQRYLNENYESELDKRKIRGNIDAENDLRHKLVTSFVVTGFYNKKPEIYYHTLVPLQDFTTPEKLHPSKNFIFHGQPDIRNALSQKFKYLSFYSESDVLNAIKDSFQWAKEKSIFIGGNTDIYKISLVEGKERIEKIQ